ncbi:MAG: phage terminase large subunit [Gammaproteobacteria bacterium]|nr:phage terminase large subunit [Gammaproteobacteria bacterium]
MSLYTPQPRQALLHKTTAQQILYGGQAGGGKSHCIRWDAIDFCLNCPGLRAVIFRRTTKQLEQNHIEHIRQLPSFLGAYNETRKTFHFVTGSMLIFKHLEHEHDVDDIQGWEIHWAGVDEAGQCTPYQLGYIKSRIRVPSDLKEKWPQGYAEKLPRLALSANPGGPGHYYLKERFIDPAPPETIFHDEHMRDESDPNDRGATTIFIPASLDDNQYLGTEYRRQFSDMPEWQQKMYRDGDWDIVAGAYFDCWDPNVHVVDPFPIPDYWTRFRACDWGFSTPFCVLWFAVSDGTPIKTKYGEVSFPDGALIVYREWYGSKRGNVGLKMDGGRHAQKIKSVEQHENVRYGVADPSMWRRDSGPSAAEHAFRSGINWRKADNNRPTGWAEVYARLNNGGDEPMLYIFDTCKHVIKTIPVLERDEKDLEDVKKQGEDHPGDALRYGCMSRPMKSVKEEPQDPYEAFKKPLMLPPVPEKMKTVRHKII